jgi:hypothetical protein
VCVAGTHPRPRRGADAVQGAVDAPDDGRALAAPFVLAPGDVSVWIGGREVDEEEPAARIRQREPQQAPPLLEDLRGLREEGGVPERAHLVGLGVLRHSQRVEAADGGDQGRRELGRSGQRNRGVDRVDVDWRDV